MKARRCRERRKVRVWVILGEAGDEGCSEASSISTSTMDPHSHRNNGTPSALFPAWAYPNGPCSDALQH